jgi:predicted F0F1-ATPase subunit
MSRHADHRYRREDMRRRTRSDIERLAKRRAGGNFWRSLALVGSVGWPIVLLALGGALLGHTLDVRWNTGVRFALMLLVAGVLAGSWIAFRTLEENGS